MLQYTLNMGNDELKKALQKAEMYYTRLNVMGKSMHHAQEALMEFWAPEIQESVALIHRLKNASYVMAKTSEIEAIARVNPNIRAKSLTSAEVSKSTSRTAFSGSVEDRVHLAYEGLAFKIARAIRIGRLLGEPPLNIVKRIRNSFPENRVIKHGRRSLAKPKIMEADIKVKAARDAVANDFYDQSEWNDMIELYQDSELWEGRFGEQKVEGVDRYKFQFEQEATEEFVAQVRAGEIQAAKDQGIDDFVWATIIDRVTCENCCAKRDGLLTSEIEKKLDTVWKNDECKATVPPAHPNCRCQVLPVSSEFVPKSEDVTYTGIDEWLESP